MVCTHVVDYNFYNLSLHHPVIFLAIPVTDNNGCFPGTFFVILTDSYKVGPYKL